MKYTAKDGYVFDWKNLEEHQYIDPETGKTVQEHLYAKVIWLAPADSIENYIEVPEND